MHHKSNVAANFLILTLKDEFHQTTGTCNSILGDMILDPTIQEACDRCNRLLTRLFSLSHSGLFDHGPKHTVVCGL